MRLSLCEQGYPRIALYQSFQKNQFEDQNIDGININWQQVREESVHG